MNRNNCKKHHQRWGKAGTATRTGRARIKNWRGVGESATGTKTQQGKEKEGGEAMNAYPVPETINTATRKDYSLFS